MKAMINYIENLFMTIPDSPQKERMKAELIQSNREKYEELIAEHKSHEEALGILIEEFGDFADIQKALGRLDTEDKGYTAEDLQTIANYKRFQPRFALGIATGVLFCIFGVAFTLLEESLGEIVVNLGFFALVAMGVVLFIYFGIKKSQFTDYFRGRQMVEYLGEDSLKNWSFVDQGDKKKGMLRAVQTTLWLIIVVIYLFIGFMWNAWHPGWIVFLVGVAIAQVIESIE